MDNELQNEQRWEEFLSDLIPYQYQRSKGEKLDKETIDGPSSISKTFATRIKETLDKDFKIMQHIINLHDSYDPSVRPGYNNEEADYDDREDDVVVIKTENMPTESPWNLSCRDLSVKPSSSLLLNPKFQQGMTSSAGTSNTTHTETLQQTKRTASDSFSDMIGVPSKCRKIEFSTKEDEEEESKTNSDIAHKKGGIKNFFTSLVQKIGGRPTKKCETQSASASYSQNLPRRNPWIKAVPQKQKPQTRSLFDWNLVSKWDVSMFSRVIHFEDDVEKLDVQTDSVDSSVASEEMTATVEETLNLLQTSLTKLCIEDTLHKETNVRIFLTAILNKVCMRLNVGIKTDEQIDFKFLPTCKFDFVFHTRDGKPIGCMEAKTPSSMTSKAFVQTVIKLLILQQLASKHQVDISTVPIFSILSDGHRFVFIQVKGEKLGVEHDKEDNGKYILKIRTTKVMESIYKIAEMTLTSMS